MCATVQTVVAVALFMTQSSPSFADGREHIVRLPWKGHAQVASKIVPPGHPQHDARCGTDVEAIISGAGLMTLLGQFFAEQSHCLRSDFSFYSGRFTFTSPDGRTVGGQYFGQLVPALLPPPSTPPLGSGVIRGNVCVEGGTVFPRILNDCAAGRYSSATGILNLDTGDGTVFIDYQIGVGR